MNKKNIEKTYQMWRVSPSLALGGGGRSFVNFTRSVPVSRGVPVGRSVLPVSNH